MQNGKATQDEVPVVKSHDPRLVHERNAMGGSQVFRIEA